MAEHSKMEHAKRPSNVTMMSIIVILMLLGLGPILQSSREQSGSITGKATDQNGNPLMTSITATTFPLLNALPLTDCTASVGMISVTTPPLKPLIPTAQTPSPVPLPPYSSQSPPWRSVITGGGFGGLNQTISGPYRPPDVALGAGPGHVVEMVNKAGLIYTKSSSAYMAFPLISLLNDRNGTTTNSTITDPQVLFDTASGASGRWFASLLNHLHASSNEGDIIIGVSQTSDPTGNWNIYVLNTGTNWADQPKIGLNDDKLVMTGAVYPSAGALLGYQIWIFNKSQMMGGMKTVNCSTYGPDNTIRKTSPVRSLTSTKTEYIVGNVSRFQTSLPQTNFILYNVTGVPGVGAGAVMTIQTLNYKQALSPPIFAEQPSGVSLDADGERGPTAVWSSGRLWFGITDSCVPPGDGANTRTCVRLTQLTTDPVAVPGVAQDFDLSGAKTYYFYPALSMDGSGNLLLVFGYSNNTNANTIFPSLAITGQAQSDSGTLVQPIPLLGGSASAPVSTTCGPNCARYGDYFGASTDTSGLVWVAGEYVLSSSQWSSFVSQPTFMIKATPSITSTVTPSSVILGQSATDLASVTGVFSPTGTATYTAYSDAACTVQVFTSPNIALGTASAPFTPSAVGTYFWIATYNGDAHNNVVSTLCNAAGETLTVNPPFDFSPSSSGGITVVQGVSGSNTIFVTLVSGSSQSVGLSCTSGLPAGASCSFNPVTGFPTFSSTLTITTLSSTPTGSFLITVTGSGGGVTHTTSFTLTVNPPPPPPPSVGGVLVPVDKLALLAPFIILASLIVASTSAAAIYVKRVKHKKEKHEQDEN